MSFVSYFDLGATLYTPCTHEGLTSVLQTGAAPVRSMVLCLEDAVGEDDIPHALNNLKVALRDFVPDHRIRRFIRPRNPIILAEMLRYQHIGKIDGFVLPKFDLHTEPLYKKVIREGDGHRFSYMPTLESEQAFSMTAMAQLRDSLQDWGQSLTCLRIGGNDLMNLLGIKRMEGMTAYETPLKTVIDQLMMVFRPHGYELSAPVFDLIDDSATLERELMMDLAYGFYAKTAVHPTQATLIEETFTRWSQQHFEQAEGVLTAQSPAVYRDNGQMMEKTCHRQWATRASLLAQRYR